MHTRYLQRRISILIAAGGIFFVAIFGCDRKNDPTVSSIYPSAAAAEGKKDSCFSGSRIPQDQPLAEYQVRLLDLAFQAASAIPVPPFLKDRSRAQEEVVNTCLKLDRPIQAVRLADQIGNWRRGLCYAETAFYLAQKGYDPQQIQPALDLAGQIARMDHGQRWRSDRIRVRIAQTHLLLGRTEEAERIRKEVEEMESGPLLETGVMIRREDSFDKQARLLDAQLSLLNFEMIQNVLAAYARLFDQYYEQPQQRTAAEEKIRASWDKLPPQIRMELLIRLARSALNHADTVKALALFKEGRLLLENSSLSLEEYIPAAAELVRLCFQAGDTEKSITDADLLHTLYDEKQDAIIDINRADAITPLAETYQEIGRPETALVVYKKAVEAAFLNPNPRPRAEDISMICNSMALAAAEPDPELWARMQELRNKLRLQ